MRSMRIKNAGIVLILGLALALMAVGPVSGTVHPGNRVAALIGLSTDTKPAADYGMTFYETDTGLTYYYTGSAWALLDVTVESAPDTLTASGGAGTAVASKGYDQVLVAALSKGASAVSCSGQLEGYQNGIGWMQAAPGDSIVAAGDSGTDAVLYQYPAVFDSVRFKAGVISASDTLIVKQVLRVDRPR